MDLEEANQKSQITEEERKAVDGYINVWHTTMNSLASFDVMEYLKASEKGWYLPGVSRNLAAEKEPTAEELGDNILSTIEDFAKVYSAMVKYGQMSRPPKKLYRGTSNREARSLQTGETYDRLISTSTAMDVAKSFCEYGDPGYLRISVGDNVPFLDVDDFMGMENMNREENEFVLAPFSQIKKAGYADRDRTYTYYDVELEAPQLRPFQEGEKESFRDRIKEDFARIIEMGKKYKNLYEMNQVYWTKYSKSHDREETQYYKEKSDECSKECHELKPELDEFSAVIKNYIQGLCLEKQREFEEASRIVSEDRRRCAEEAHSRKVEEQRQGTISAYNTKLPNTLENLEAIPISINTSYKELINKAMNYSEMSRMLGIPFNYSIDNGAIQQYVMASGRNVGMIQENIKTTSIDENSLLENAISASEKLDRYNGVAVESLSLTNELNSAINIYDSEALNDVKHGIDNKVQDIIRRTKMQILSQQRKAVQDRKISFIGRIFGGQKLKEAELQNLDLQIEVERTKPFDQNKEKYSIQDSLADMLAFSKGYLGGQFTPEMQDFSSKITKCFQVNEAYIDGKANQKLAQTQSDNALIPLNNYQKESTKDRINRLNQNSEQLRAQVQNNGYQNSMNFGRTGVVPNDGVRRFMDILSRVSQITQMHEFFSSDKTQQNIHNMENRRQAEDSWENR